MGCAIFFKIKKSKFSKLEITLIYLKAQRINMASKKGSNFDPFFDSMFNTSRIHRRRRTIIKLCSLNFGLCIR